MPYTSTSSIEVMCWGAPVGVLALDPASGYYAFEYYPDFQASGIELAPLTVPLSTAHPIVAPHLSEQTYFRLPAFVADSLPDRFGNALIDAWMADQGVARNNITPLDRLAYMGKRGMGALEFRPAAQTGDALPSVLEVQHLVETARRALSVNFIGEAQVEEDAALGQLISVGSSAGGARAKAVVGWNRETGDFVSGQFELPDGYEHWIMKFDMDSASGQPRQYGKVEYAYYLMACACGIRMAESCLQKAAGSSHFMTRRFDRTHAGKVHMQTLCGIAELDFNMVGAFSAAQLFETAIDLGLALDALDELFDRMVFNICMANNDDHTKNWSFLLQQGGQWELAPAYDLTYAFAEGNPWLSQHFMSVNGKFTDVERKDLLVLAERFSVSHPGDRIDSIVAVANHWESYAKEAELSANRMTEIGATISQCSSRLL